MIRAIAKYKTHWLLCILMTINLGIRLSAALHTGLGVDEAYYVSYARYLDWSYFDHPPLVGYLIWLTTAGLSLSGVFFVRLGALLIGTINLYLIFEIGARLYDRTTGLLAAILLSNSLYASILAGTFILPDTPLSLFWLLSLWSFARFLSEKKDRFLLLFGTAVGLALLSKYQSVFLWGGALLFLWLYDRKKLQSKTLILSIGISLILFLPVLLWNYQSPYSGLAYQAHRVGNDLPKLSYFFPALLGSIFYNNPFNYYLIVLGLIFFIKNRKVGGKPATAFLLCSSLPLIAVVLGLSLFNRILPHWSGPAYYGLILTTAHFVRLQIKAHNTKAVSRAIKGGALFFILLVAVTIAVVKYNFLPLGKDHRATRLGSRNPATDLMVWPAAAAAIQRKVARDLREKRVKKNYVILSDNWFPAAHLDYYYAMPNGVKLYVLGNSNNQHNYMRSNLLQGPIPLGSDAYYISPSHRYRAPSRWLISRFKTVDGPDIMPISVDGKPAIELSIWRMNDMKSPLFKARER